jgi:predicted ester cyclase
VLGYQLLVLLNKPLTGSQIYFTGCRTVFNLLIPSESSTAVTDYCFYSPTKTYYMREILLPVCAFCFFGISSCNSGPDTKVASATMSTQAQKNVDADKMITEAFKTGDANKLDSAVSTDFVDHTDMGDKKGIDSLKNGVNMVHNQFKDMKMELKRQWADDDYVVDWVRYTGTNPTPMMGMPAGPYDIKGMEVSRFSNGKAVEHWFFYDNQMVMGWMKGMQGMGANMMDSTKKKNK